MTTQKTEGRVLYAWILISIIILGGIASMLGGWMRWFMGCFFLIVSILKFLDRKGFVKAYQKYDLIAKSWAGRGWIYPIIELLLGVAYLMNFELTIVAMVTFVIMVIGSIGVGIKLAKNEKFQCACLGTKLNIPLTKLTFVEDILMAVMALVMIL